MGYFDFWEKWLDEKNHFLVSTHDDDGDSKNNELKTFSAPPRDNTRLLEQSVNLCADHVTVKHFCCRSLKMFQHLFKSWLIDLKKTKTQSQASERKGRLLTVMQKLESVQ